MPTHSELHVPPALQPELARVTAQIRASGLPRALWERRLDMWGPEQVQRRVGQRLGWLSAVDASVAALPRLATMAAAARADGFTDVVLLGMGGSSLAPEVIHRVIGPAPDAPRFTMLDSVNPSAVRSALARADTSLFVLASKSGSTIEPNALAAEARRRVEAAGHVTWGSRFIAVTDPDTDLHRRAETASFRDIFLNPSDIGGRYSALSLFGMVPAALMGIAVPPLLARAQEMADACRAEQVEENPGLQLGALLGAAALAGRDKLTLWLPPELEAIGLWIEQLVAESTGKAGRGIVPIVGEHQRPAYLDDRVVVAMKGWAPHTTAGRASHSLIEEMRHAQAPVLQLLVPDRESLAAEFFRWEFATAIAGFVLGVNPFDEPNVQQAKEATRRLLTIHHEEGSLPTSPADLQTDAIRVTLTRAAREAAKTADVRFLDLVRPGDYIGLLAFASPFDRALTAVFEQFRATLAARTAAATTFGFGPRYLHSTGQLHKGGAPNGVFVIITGPSTPDIQVPDDTFTFGVLEVAQARGDFLSLDTNDRRAVLIELSALDASTAGAALHILLESPLVPVRSTV